MSTEYEWSYEIKVASVPISGKDDVIREVHWKLTGTSDDTNPIIQSAYGNISLDDPDDNDIFIDFADVSQDMCKEWVIASVGHSEDDMKAAVQAQIDIVKTPPLIQKIPSSWG